MSQNVHACYMPTRMARAMPSSPTITSTSTCATSLGRADPQSRQCRAGSRIRTTRTGSPCRMGSPTRSSVTVVRCCCGACARPAATRDPVARARLTIVTAAATAATAATDVVAGDTMRCGMRSIPRGQHCRLDVRRCLDVPLDLAQASSASVRSWLPTELTSYGAPHREPLLILVLVQRRTPSSVVSRCLRTMEPRADRPDGAPRRRRRRV